MSSEWSQRRAKLASAAEKRRLCVEAGPLFAEVAIAEQRIRDEQPGLYALLSRMTVQELEAFALQNK